jgi:hypothetical protein
MARRPAGLYRTWPWVALILAGLLTTAEGASYVTLGWLTVGAGVALAARAVRHNRAVRRAARTAARLAALAAAASAASMRPAQSRQQPARRPRGAAAGRGSRRPAMGRRLAREFTRLLP